MHHQTEARETNTLGQSQEPTLNPGATRLAVILISEAAYLIWTLRCDRVINNRSHSTNEVESAWRRAINRRLAEDVITATKISRQDDFIKLVKSTWMKALQKKHRELPENWLDLQPHF
jgi:hypothetical protein